MRAKMLMVAVTAAWLTLASSAGAGEFECKIPWWRPGTVQCGNLGSVPPGKFVSIEVLSMKDDDGKDLGVDVPAEVVDVNTNKAVVEDIVFRGKSLASYKNETKTEVSARLDVSCKERKTVHLKVRYTPSP